MGRICATPKPLYILERLINSRLWLRVTRISSMDDKVGTQIEEWAVYGSPAESSLIWSKYRQFLPANLKLWGEAIRSEFCGDKGIRLIPLG